MPEEKCEFCFEEGYSKDKMAVCSMCDKKICINCCYTREEYNYCPVCYWKKYKKRLVPKTMTKRDYENSKYLDRYFWCNTCMRYSLHRFVSAGLLGKKKWRCVWCGHKL